MSKARFATVASYNEPTVMESPIAPTTLTSYGVSSLTVNSYIHTYTYHNSVAFVMLSTLPLSADLDHSNRSQGKSVPTGYVGSQRDREVRECDHMMLCIDKK